MKLPQFNPRAKTLIAAMAMSLALAACDKASDSRSAGQKLDAAVAKTERAAAGVKAEARTAGQEIKKGAANIVQKVDQLTNDATITASVKVRLAEEESLNALKIEVNTSAGTVMLSGSAPTEAAKALASAIAKSVDGVTAVENQLAVAPAKS